MTSSAIARGSAVKVLVRISMKRFASSQPSSLNTSSPWSIARRMVGGAALSSAKPACAMSRRVAKSLARPAPGRERKRRRVQTCALQALLQAPEGLRIAGEIDELLVCEVDRDRALVDIHERRDHFLAHEARGVDLRFAPAGGQPFLRDESE